MKFGSRDVEVGEGGGNLRQEHTVCVWLCRCQEAAVTVDWVRADAVMSRWIRSVALDICHWLWSLAF